jgi:hypothetical protein
VRNPTQEEEEEEEEEEDVVLRIDNKIRAWSQPVFVKQIKKGPLLLIVLYLLLLLGTQRDIQQRKKGDTHGLLAAPSCRKCEREKRHWSTIYSSPIFLLWRLGRASSRSRKRAHQKACIEEEEKKKGGIKNSLHFYGRRPTRP